MPMLLEDVVRRSAGATGKKYASLFGKRSSSIGAVTGAAIAVCLASAPSRASGYTFTNFDPALTQLFIGSNVNGISNTGQVVGTAFAPDGSFLNFTGTATSATLLNVASNQMAFGINSAGDVVGGNGATAFFLPHGGIAQTLSFPAGAVDAFGINDHGAMVGQFQASTGATPGFYLSSSSTISPVTINAPSGPDIVNAQGINNDGLIVGYYVGTDGQDHGFIGNTADVVGGVLTGVAVADPIIVPEELGATFVFSQLLGVNDAGIAVGYYGDSTTSQHAFLYNTHTGAYTFLDDPAEQFDNGVEVTQITGIANSGEIAGFYTDANGLAHDFTACPTGAVCSASVGVPEPSTWATLLAGFAGIAFARRRRSRAGKPLVA